MTVHSPKLLADQAKEVFVSLVLSNVTAPGMNKLQIPPINDLIKTPEKYSEFDQMILSSERTFPHLLPKKQIFLEHLQKLKCWWENHELIGTQNNEFRREIKRSFSSELELMDPDCIFPLFRLLLQVVFSQKAGNNVSNTNLSKIRLELPKNCCSTFNDVLMALKPFGIEELSTECIVLGDPEPWITIIKNSKLLRKVHFRNNICDEIILCVGSHCSEIETFILEQVFGEMLVSIDCLYRTFFSGLDREAIDSSQAVHLSFPKLKWVDLNHTIYSKESAKSHAVTKFQCEILNIYPAIRSVSCHFGLPLDPFIIKNLVHSRSMVNIQHISFAGLISWIEHLVCQPKCDGKENNNEDILKSFKGLKHITIHTDKMLEEKLLFAEHWLPLFKISHLTICLPYVFSMELNDQLSSYTPLLSKIGNNLTSLRLHFEGPVDVVELCRTINIFPNLCLLELKLYGIIAHKESDVSIKTLNNLTSLSILEMVSEDGELSRRFAKGLISVSPKLQNLELRVANLYLHWKWFQTATKFLRQVENLWLSSCGVLMSHSDINASQIRVSLSLSIPEREILPIIELLPNLQVLILDNIGFENLLKLQTIYQTTGLKILTKRNPYIGNRLVGFTDFYF